jgi:prepilin-type processing-associated H-X9-DG protein
MRQAQLALIFYLEDNDHYFPQCDTPQAQRWHAVFTAAGYEFAGNRCPSSRNTGVSTDLITYAYNGGLGSDVGLPWSQRRLTSGVEASAAKIITFCESYGNFFWNWQGGQGEKCGEPWDGRRGVPGRLVFHHNDGQNLTFLDGHVEYRHIATLSYEDWSVDY